MPRIEYLPTDYNENSDDGSPTIDVCQRCAGDFEEGKSLARCMSLHELRKTHLDVVADALVGETDVDHQKYDDCDYNCEVCDRPLTGKDD